MLNRCFTAVHAHPQRHCGLPLMCAVLWATLLYEGCSPPVTGPARIGSSGASSIGSHASVEEGEPTRSPRIVVERTTHDFGRMRPGSADTALFQLTNAGGGALQITDVRRCCGAVTNLEKTELAPGEHGVLTAQYRAGAVVGPFKRQIGLVTNDPQNPLVQLTITGEVFQTLTWTPIRFEIAAYKEGAPCPQIAIKSLDNTPFSVRGFVATGQCLTADFAADQKATEFTLKPRIDAAKLAALTTTSGMIRIDLDHPDYKVANVMFDVTPALQATPTQLLVFNATAGEAVLRELKVQDNRADPDTGIVEVESVAAKNGTRVELRHVTPDKTNCDLKLAIWSSSDAQNQSFSTDDLIVKMKDGRELLVPLRVFYQKPVIPATTDPSPSL